jgi:vacuolar-type H+-ATPase subunit E/Vma4
MNQEDKLKQELLADANAQAAEIMARAQEEADRMIEQARRHAAERREARLAAAMEEAEKRCRSIFADIELETSRRWLRKQEACIDELLQTALAKADKAEGFDRASSLASLAKEALAAIGDRDCSVFFNPADEVVVTRDWLQKLSREVYPGSTSVYVLKADPSIDGGIVLKTKDGARQVDNSYRTRLLRMKDGLRLVAIS